MDEAFAFATAGESRFGRGVAAEAVPRVAALGRRALLVEGGTPARRIGWRRRLKRRGGGDAVAEPDLARIEDGVAVARDAGAEVVVSLGRGAAIDAGKAVAALAPATRPVMDRLELVGRDLPLEAAPLPFVALPATAGTGAEVTRNAMIGIPQARRKVSLRDARMLARGALVDPALTDATPRAVTLASGLDAVTQVIEPYVSRRANRLSDALCREAIPAGLAALARLMEAEEAVARDHIS